MKNKKTSFKLSDRMEEFMKYDIIYKTSTSFVVEIKNNG